MTGKPKLRDRLVKQNGTSATTSTELRHKILATDEARVRRMKWAVGISWTVFLAFFFLAALLEYGQSHDLPFMGFQTGEVMRYLPEYRWLVPMCIIIAQALFVLAVVMTFLLYASSRTLTIHQIQANLAGIEEQLRKMNERPQ
ncbi:MAG: hypothetical protein JW993_00980 [Sedimentisphaerales bacterium]|nr:hypothetical protein [Sedimentisphaerales bacterium]